ncbi:hypothetical protein K502DRAFT_196944 [Neoconidiobolus thromboides FSU 785]|nr:hypothetical protein K502DRAFT_196944 [Neoconidiobolus thromboides FSU 785]
MVKIEVLDSDSENEYQYESSNNTRRRTRKGGRNGNNFKVKPEVVFKIFERKHPSTIKRSAAKQSLKRVKKLSETLDNFSFNPFPIPIGLDAIIGLIPWVGDPITLMLALFQVYLAFTGLGLPYAVVFRMLFNVFLDFFIGIIPFVGDLIDTMFQANVMNHKLAKEYFDSNVHLYQEG